jgi:hypothetical protein
MQYKVTVYPQFECHTERSRSALKFLSIDNSVVNPNNIVKYWSFLSFDSAQEDILKY